MEDPATLHELGLREAERGNAAMAIALQRHALRSAPEHDGARRALAVASQAIRDPAVADAHFRAATAREPSIDEHHHDVGALERFVGMDEVEHLLRAALDADPAHARAHAAAGNVAARRGDRSGAMAAYALAVLLDWNDADLQLGLAQLYDTADRAADGARHLHEALARKTFYRSAAPYAARRVVLLKTAGGYLSNALLEFCIDPRRTDLDTIYLTPETAVLPELPDDVVLFNAISETEAHAATIERAIALANAQPRAVLNHPRFLRNVRRTELAARLSQVDGAGAVSAVRASRSDAIRLAFPLLMRPVDTHRGDGLERIDDAPGVAGYVARNPAAAYVLAPFVDYRSRDGYYRKYRVIVIGGVPYPYHLGISESWLVHYWRASGLMREHAWMRAEEERFLREPESVFPGWKRVFGGIAAALGLDYFGVDCTLRDDGSVLVFECDPSAFVHCREAPDDVFAYKFAYVPRIFAALDELLERNRQAGPLDEVR